MKSIVHLVRKRRTKRHVTEKITACGNPVNKRTMKVTDSLDEIDCELCANSRYVKLIRNMK